MIANLLTNNPVNIKKKYFDLFAETIINTIAHPRVAEVQIIITYVYFDRTYIYI